MANDDNEQDADLVHSPLEQSVIRDGKSVQVHIYGDGDGSWLLEVEDNYGNSTVWNTQFSSDKEALDEALRTIEKEGIDTLIGKLPAAKPVSELDQPLLEAELDLLDDFLSDETIQDTSMDVSTLDGFLTAIAIGPRFVRPSEWLPWIWDMDEGEADPVFLDQEEASKIVSLIMRHYNTIIHVFNTDPESFDPIFWQAKQWGAAEWCEGFLLGFMFNDEAWSLLAAGQPTWFTPFLRLGTEEGVDITAKEDDAEKWMHEIEPSLLRIHAYWKDYQSRLPAGARGTASCGRGTFDTAQFVRDGPKIGRNDPCPCGSGQKFKKCCGAAGAPSTVH